MAKSSLPHSTLPSYARSPVSRRETLASTTAAATFSKVRLLLSFPRPLSSSPLLTAADRGAQQVWHVTLARAQKEEDQGREAADAPRTAPRRGARCCVLVLTFCLPVGLVAAATDTR